MINENKTNNIADTNNINNNENNSKNNDINKKKRYGDKTLEVHAGHEDLGHTGSRAVPIYQTTAYVFDDVDDAKDRFSLDKDDNIYIRLNNPTTSVFEDRVAAIEGGVGGLAQSSGASAIVLSILNISKLGDNIVSADNLYGGTINFFTYTLPKLGRSVKYVKCDDIEGYKNSIDDKTKAIFVESIGNPRLDVPDFETIAEIAHENDIPLIVDNTAGIGLFKPIEHGADIVVYSATKYIGGHGNSLGGVIVDSGNFDWTNGKFSEFNTPDPSYHGIIFTEKFGDHAFVVKARTQLLRDLGTTISPFNSFQLIQGLETLSLRMKQHSDNALKVAEFLKKNPNVAWVSYPGLEDDSNHEIASKYLKDFGGLVAFGIKGGLVEGKKFIKNVELLSHVANIGDSRTLVTHPASTTHSQLSKEELDEVGVTPDFIRLSIGLENIEDIINDIDQALKKAVQ
ncbi:hypothetical protein ALNOE001_18440 [Candidatus Methanobinarius endosymbioticus]|uniref:O-acetylhomoserine aminocarboxypropyltransferase n=1 Tax=Candidatus Methanobinarius endosymbioticus TaxID=2006182 RepID=A0A366M8S7_9EURY|nr:hypothetical protein ALNOE001_18440 [Candidatus Methanobinarius endosymbioticus]